MSKDKPNDKSKMECPLITKLKQETYSAPRKQDMMKYLNQANNLAKQGDHAFCDGNHEVAFVCYYGVARMWIDHIKKHPDFSENRYSKALKTVKGHFEMAVPRLEDLVPLIEELYEQRKLQNAGFQFNTNNNTNSNLNPSNGGGMGVGTAVASAIGGAVGGSLAGNIGANLGSQAGAALSEAEIMAKLLGMTNSSTNTTTDLNTNNLSSLSLNDNPAPPTNPGMPHLDGYIAPTMEVSPVAKVTPTSVSDLSKRLFTEPELDEYGMPKNNPKYNDLSTRTAFDDIMNPLPPIKFDSIKRKLHIPSLAMKMFLKYASYNTQEHIETCGILAGKTINNVYYVTHIIIPEQIGEPSNVTTVKEELMMMLLERLNLITLGWIHTHPMDHNHSHSNEGDTQATTSSNSKSLSFLSSIDLHTQYYYQSSRPESVAIVCAPYTSENEVFSLSDTGMVTIGNCTKGGDNFHKHENSYNVYGSSPHIVIHYPPKHPLHDPKASTQTIPMNRNSGDLAIQLRHTAQYVYGSKSNYDGKDRIAYRHQTKKLYEIEMIDLRNGYERCLDGRQVKFDVNIRTNVKMKNHFDHYGDVNDPNSPNYNPYLNSLVVYCTSYPTSDYDPTKDTSPASLGVGSRHVTNSDNTGKLYKKNTVDQQGILSYLILMHAANIYFNNGNNGYGGDGSNYRGGSAGDRNRQNNYNENRETNYNRNNQNNHNLDYNDYPIHNPTNTNSNTYDNYNKYDSRNDYNTYNTNNNQSNYQNKSNPNNPYNNNRSNDAYNTFDNNYNQNNRSNGGNTYNQHNQNTSNTKYYNQNDPYKPNQNTTYGETNKTPSNPNTNNYNTSNNAGNRGADYNDYYSNYTNNNNPNNSKSNIMPY